MKVKISKEELEKVVSESVSVNEVHKKLPIFSYSGGGRLRLVEHIKSYNISIEHFSKIAVSDKIRKYPIIIKICPICQKEFEARQGEPKEKQTCSYGCSNTLFKTKRVKTENLKLYRNMCFRVWEKECALCKFDKVVEVHHIDENRDNNTIPNLIPLCPNHHVMVHTAEWSEDIKKQISEKINIRNEGV